MDEETFYECRHCSQDSDNLIVKLKQEMIRLQKINKEKNVLIDNLSFKVSDLVAEYQKPKKWTDEETLSCNNCSQKFPSEHILGDHIKSYHNVGCE